MRTVQRKAELEASAHRIWRKADQWGVLKAELWDFPGGPLVKTLPSSANLPLGFLAI